MKDVDPPRLLGYLLKRVVSRPEWTEDPRVKRVCSVSGCLSGEPETKHTLWRFNAGGAYDTEELAASTEPAASRGEWSRFALALFPLEFQHGTGSRVSVDDLIGADASALPRAIAPGYRLLGYDAVSGWRSEPPRDGQGGILFQWHCSPLSCNMESPGFDATEDCLLRTAEEAFAAAERFSKEEPEPGPYYVFAVYARDPIVENDADGGQSCRPSGSR